jgi:hypothetical protein
MSLKERKRKKKIKEVVIKRDGLVCCYCSKELSLETLTLDHIIPDSRSGCFNSTNLTVSCAPCNNKRGTIPFFEYCIKFNFPEDKLNKYKLLSNNNLKIKVLNIAKENCLIGLKAIPSFLIKEACKILSIDEINYSEYKLEFNFDEIHSRRSIKFNFENLIRLIESQGII